MPHSLIRHLGRLFLDHDGHTFMEILTEITRALVGPIAGQLKSLNIPVWDIEWYLEHVQEFRSLEHVTFLEVNVDSLTTFSEVVYRGIVNYLGLEGYGENLGTFDIMCAFIKQHSETFKDILRTVDVFHTKTHMTYETTCTVPQLVELLGLLPPLKNPRHLDQSSILHFLVHADKTNLDYINSISIPRYAGLGIVDMLSTNPPFLHRCRRLRHLQIPVTSPDMFKWAVKERTLWNDSLRRDISSDDGEDRENTQLNISSVLEKTQQQHPLVGPPIQLTSIKLLELNELNLRSIDDVIFAFGNTLRDLSFLQEWFEHIRPMKEDEMQDVVVIDQKWMDRLPHLRRIRIDFGTCLRAWIQPEAMGRLQVTKFSVSQSCHDETMFPPGLAESVIEPMNATGLKTIKLLGLAAANFHPDSFQSAKELEKVEVGMRSALSQLESPHELLPTVLLRQRDVLMKASWDWYLPCLHTLILYGNFAEFFKFRMLRRCPSLKHLGLYIPTTRVLTVEELKENGYCATGTVDIRELTGTEAREEEKQVMAPNLEKFMLTVKGLILKSGSI
ncbi:hypothetical protein BGW38_007449 [Lunasporangiospora selenospora]|uniref:Uncharacterized protein n=1 Tax=Lunasporangiospora selenospora TaxID=979761 RepID=A0A9P6KFY7_9FUNG|nr:hypothetical protein BGW38_007449 [Lunasporangiospora selenospora]